MGLEIEKPAFPQFLQLVPCHGIGSMRDYGWIDEKGYGNSIFLYEGEHVRKDCFMSVVGNNNY